MAACVVCQAAATVYCQNDKAFLCNACDVTIHSSNLVAGRHTRVSVCECCNKAAAAVFCKNDRAFLCEACDVEVHAGNPLAASHEIVSVDKLCEEQSVQKQNSDMCESHSATTPCCSTDPSATAVRSSTTAPMPPAARARASPACSEAVVPVLMPADSQQPQMMLPSSKDSLYKGTWGKDFDGLELDNAWLDRLDVGFDFSDILAQDANDADDHGLVPNLGPRAASLVPSVEQQAAAVPEMPALDGRSDSYDDCTVPRLAMHNLEHAFSLDDDFMPSFKVPFTGPPDASYLVQAPMASVNNSMILQTSLPFNAQPQPIMHVTSQQAALNREQRVLRYREKRKNRKFEKTIRYASRKAYAEVRPRIKGRFAKKEEIAAWEAAGDAMVPEVSGGMMKVEMVSMQ